MSPELSFRVLLVSASEYRIDGEFRYSANELPRADELIKVVDELSGAERAARVRRVGTDGPFAIHAIDVTPLPADRRVAPRDHARRGSQGTAVDATNARRGWLKRRRRRRSSEA